MTKRSSGVLLHPTSLPSPYGIGDFGPGAYRFVDFLFKSKQHYWQILPLTPISPALGNSPYNSFSAFAGSTLLISPEILVTEKLILKEDLEEDAMFSSQRVDYPAAIQFKEKILNLAFKNWKGLKRNEHFEKFKSTHEDWLKSYCLFVALKEHFKGAPWWQWPKALRDRDEKTLEEFRGKLGERIEAEQFFQYLFFKQWFALKKYCEDKGIKVIGDLPIYVGHDSVDVWANQGIFKLDENKKPKFISGVPPDYFSETGQLWGNPVYDWEALKARKYDWWLKRLHHQFELYHVVRIDHFRGLVAYWEVPAKEKTAIKGAWVNVPTDDFLSTLLNSEKNLPVIAEDLGLITDDVKEVMKKYGFPGMKILLFAFDGEPEKNPYMPFNHVKDCIVYTGTHDNNTAKGWFEKEASAEAKKRFFHYLGRQITAHDVPWEFVKLAMTSIADTAIIPIQDLLGLGEEARMNKPGTCDDNWQWRLPSEALSPLLISKLRETTETYGRSH